MPVTEQSDSSLQAALGRRQRYIMKYNDITVEERTEDGTKWPIQVHYGKAILHMERTVRSQYDPEVMLALADDHKDIFNARRRGVRTRVKRSFLCA